MEITLEKIELVKDRTGVTYKEAKDALEAANGSVVDAIINIEEAVDAEQGEETASAGKNLVENIKKTISKGNMSKLIIKKNGEVLLNLPLTAGVLGAVIAPWGVIVGIIAAAGSKCTVEFINDKGETTDVSGKVIDSYNKAKEKGQEAVDKGQESIDKIKESDLYKNIKEKSDETIDKIKESEFYNDAKKKGDEAVDKIKSKTGEAKKEYDKMMEDGLDKKDIEKIKQEVREGIKELRRRGEDSFAEIKKKGDALLKKEDGEEPFLYEFEDEGIDVGDVPEDFDEKFKFVEKHDKPINDVTAFGGVQPAMAVEADVDEELADVLENEIKVDPDLGEIHLPEDASVLGSVQNGMEAQAEVDDELTDLLEAEQADNGGKDEIEDLSSILEEIERESSHLGD